MSDPLAEYVVRLERVARDLGLDTILGEPAIMLIEWPERAGAWAPPPSLHLKRGYATDPARRTVERVA